MRDFPAERNRRCGRALRPRASPAWRPAVRPSKRTARPARVLNGKGTSGRRAYRRSTRDFPRAWGGGREGASARGEHRAEQAGARVREGTAGGETGGPVCDWVPGTVGVQSGRSRVRTRVGGGAKVRTRMSEPISPSGRAVIPVAHGQLEAILREPAAPIAAAVVCHPHPRGGGTMNNNVVYRLAKALVDGGVAVLRFNFRGVGASTGATRRGRRGGRRARRARLPGRAPPGVPLWMAGFSFGARVGLTVGARDRASRSSSASAWRSRCSTTVPRRLRQAEGDHPGRQRRVRRARRRSTRPSRDGRAEAPLDRRRRHAPLPRPARSA